MKEKKEIIVDSGDFFVSNGSKTLVTKALGSCVAIALYDKIKKIGGLVHFILPENPGNGVQARYADTGIQLLVKEMIERGAKKENLEAKMVGGAIMFEDFMDDVENSIGNRNIEKGKEILKEIGISILSDDIGGNYARSVEFHLSDGKVYVSSYKTGVKII